MIALRLSTTTVSLQDSFLELSESTQVSINAVCPIFDQENISRTFSYNFKLPASPHNMSLLGHPDRLDSPGQTGTDRGYPAMLYIEGVCFEEGLLILVNCDTQIEARFVNKESDLMEDLEVIKIKERLEQTSIALATNSDVIEVYEPDPNEDIWRLNVDSATVGFDRTLIAQFLNITTYEGAIIYLTFLINVQVNANIASYELVGGVYRIRMDYSVIDINPVISNNQNVPLIQTIPPGGDQQTLVTQFIADTYATPRDDIAFPYMYNPNHYDGKVEGWTGHINEYYNGIMGVNGRSIQPDDEEYNPYWQRSWIPLLRYPYLLDFVADLVGLTAIDLSPVGGDIQSLLLYNNYAIDDVLAADAGGGNTEYTNAGARTITLSNHVPDWTGKGLLVRLLKHFALYGVLDNGRLAIYKMQDIINQPAEDWTHLAEPEFSLSKPEDTGYILRQAEDGTQDFNLLQYSQLRDRIVEPAQRDITLPFTSAYMDTVDPVPDTSGIDQSVSAPGPARYIPSILQEGSSAEFSDNDYGPLLLFDRGAVLGSDGFPYIYASPYYRDGQGNTVGTESLDLNDPQGLYEVYHKGVIELSEAPVIQKILRLRIHDLINLRKDWRNAVKTIRHDKGTICAVIKSIEITATTTTLQKAKVTFVKLG